MLETGWIRQNTLQYEHLQLLLQISHQGVATQQQLTDDAVSCLEQQVNQQRQAQQAMQQDLQQQQEASRMSHHTQEPHAKPHQHGRSWHKRRKLIGAVVWGVASLLQHSNLPLRAVKAASLLFVIHEHGREMKIDTHNCATCDKPFDLPIGMFCARWTVFCNALCSKFI